MASCSVYWNWVLEARRADGHVLRGLQVDPEARDLRQLRPEAGDNLEGVASRSSCGLSVMNMRPLFCAEFPTPTPRPIAIVATAGSLHDDRAGLLLQLVHGRERDVLAGLGRAEQDAGVLLREEPLGDDREEIDGRRKGRKERHQRREPVAQDEVHAALVAASERQRTPALTHVEEPAVVLLVVAFEQSGRHHRGQRQRDESRHRDRHGDRDREFAEQAADDAAHHQERDQHRHQRNGDRDDGEADLGRALQRRLEGFLPLLDVAGDVLQHHDRVVDNEADRYGEGHKGQVVEAIARRPHQRAGAEQRERHRDARDDRRPETPQEDEDHHHDQRDGEHQGELDVLDRGADGGGAVGEQL